MNSLDGKIVLVTGASRGIGKAIADAFQHAGARVIGVARSQGCDVSNEEHVERLFKNLQQRHGTLHILVNNAGILTPRKPIVEVTAHEWDETMAVNLRGVFLCTRAALRLMLRQRSGLIVNLTSGVGRRAAPEWGPYAVSKWGVEGFTKVVAEEVKSTRIKVVAVNPRPTRTHMRALAYPDEDPRNLKTPGELGKFFVALATGEIKFENGDSVDYPGA
ncbi:MAG TPA: SDR family oxidoreductase [Verrucomicrobiae bacterium]|nr:SDR family oxidoreductase [Verrucomicrobiae bacterium]